LLWTVIDSAMRTQLSGFDARPTSLAFSADGILAGGSWDGAVWFWRHGRCPEICTPWPQPLSARSENEPGNGRPLPPGRGRGGPPERGGRPPRGGEPGPERDRPTSLAFDASGRLIAHSSQGLRVWSAGTLSAQTPPAVELPLPQTIGAFSLTPVAKTADGKMMVLVRPAAVFLWRAEKPDELIAVIPPSHAGPESLSPSVGAVRRATSPGSDPPNLRIRAAQLSPGGDRIYLIDQSGLMHAWAIDSRTDGADAKVQARELDWAVPMADAASSLTLRRDGKLLAVGDRAGTVTLVDTQRTRVLERIKPSSGEGESLVLALAFSPQGHDLAVGSQQGTISIWSVAQPTKPRLRLRLPGQRQLVTNLAFDPTGLRLATAPGGDPPLVEVWDLELIERELARLGLSD
jgi:eukaryotic-like serine/threonine-protein kinase